MKKLKVMIISIIVVFSFFLMVYFKERDYSVNYKIDKYTITEKYDKSKEKYYINVKYKNKYYFYIVNKKYTHKRKLVNNIKLYQVKNESCMTLNFDKEKTIPSCILDNEYISYNLTSSKMKKKLGKKYFNTYKNKSNKTYKNIDINTYFGKKIYVWNYHGFYALSSSKNKDIKIFNKDIYDVNLIGQIDKYLVIPNYNNEYEYKSLKILNTEDNKIENLKLSDNLSDESYVLGTNEDSIYIFDTKYKTEFEIVPYKNKYRTINPKIYNKGKEEEKTSLSLANNKTEFIYDTIYSYKLIGDKLYQYNKYNNKKVLVTNKSVKELVKENENEVYYIVDDKLYVYSNKYGEVLLLTYFELNFNYKNIFYIF